ncbi:MAG: aldo/keto reductase [Synergistaceae bacterium]|nr:aldo/keto reductase [Synergistaceae bacterium]MBR0204379.1 aldo/keto reductase [Synergistaceae bacterium]
MRKILLMLIIFLAASPVHALGTQYVTLNDGSKMPVFGFGTWTLSDSQAEELVYTAIKAGYRLIDTARYYRNESGVGRGVRRAISEGLLKREEIFITSKLIPGYNPDEAIDDSNKTLGLDYIDLMLIHQPGYNDEEVYKALERAVNSGKVKSIGISNYYTPEEFERINRIASITPAIVQNENHIFYQNNDLKKYLERYGTVIESWYPLGGRGNTHELFNNEAVKKIAASHGKTAAQVIIRWHIQAGYIAIPGSKNPEHIRENINVFDFALTDNDMNIIAGLNQNKRFEVW